MLKKTKVFIGFIATLLLFASCVTGGNVIDGNIAVTYTTITEGQDWGPAISKVVLDLGTNVDPTSVSAEKFSAISVKNYQGFSFATGQMEPEATDHEGKREILSAYVSDEMGNKADKGNFITLEMKIGPNNSEGSPFYYEFISQHNMYAETYYKLSTTEDISLKNGQLVSISETGKSEYKNNISLVADDFVNNVDYTYENIDLKYAYYTPESSKKGKTPLIIWLHGLGEGGDNTYLTLLGNEVVNLATENIQQYFGETGAMVLAPQNKTYWMDATGNSQMNVDTEGNTGESFYTESLMSLITDFVNNNPLIDTDRIYIGGCSNGAYMTMNLLMEYPGYFAAAYPSATPYFERWTNDKKIENIKDTPIWFVQSMDDNLVNVFKGQAGANFRDYILDLDENGNEIAIYDHAPMLMDKLTKAGNKNVYMNMYEHTADTTGLYFQEDGVTPYQYSGHWSWIYTLNNYSTQNINGEEVTIFEWLSRQSK